MVGCSRRGVLAILALITSGGIAGAATSQSALADQAVTEESGGTETSSDQSPSKIGDSAKVLIEPLAIEEVVVTGSVIRTKDLDQALPVTLYDIAEIQAAGVSNVNEFIEKLPAMQNMAVPGDSVGGTASGLRSANLRGIGSSYTLTLLDGRRMSPFGSGSTVNLSAIPLAAIERIEVLKEGASALYGSDAIAGVVNFVLKDSVEGTTVSTRFDEPLKGGAESSMIDLVAGFGDFLEDGYSFVLGYSREKQDALAASDRPFADTGFITFREDGEEYYFNLSSANSIPGNAVVYTEGYGRFLRFFNPDQLQNGGVCAPQTTPDGDSCRFDYTSTLEILPEHESDSLFVNGSFRIGDNLTGSVTGLYSENLVIERIAPFPTGQVPVPFDSDIVQSEVIPHLTPEEAEIAGEVTGYWRALPAGNRASEYDIETTNLTFALEGSQASIDYDVALTWASMTRTDDWVEGHLIEETFLDLVTAGQINIFANQDEFGDHEALAPAIFNGVWTITETETLALSATAASPIFELPGGEAMLAVGADWRDSKFNSKPSQANLNEVVLFSIASTPYQLQRSQYGVFAELRLPITDRFELHASLRYDNFDGVEDNLRGLTLGDGHADETYKVGTLFRATDWLTIRGSFGTGFKAPSMTEIGNPRSGGGVTSRDYACPFAANDPMASLCRHGKSQYDIVTEGRPDLTFETSEQWSLGVAMSPFHNLDLTIDYWKIEVNDIVVSVGADAIFAYPDEYRDRFTAVTNPATGQEELAIIQSLINAGGQKSKGIDIAVSQAFRFGWADLTVGVTGTWLDESEGALATTPGKFSGSQVWIERRFMYLVDLEHGKFSHNLRVQYRSGYDDIEQPVELLGTSAPLGYGPTVDIRLHIGEQSLADYRLNYTTFEDRLKLTLGVNNLTNEEPQLSLRDSGSHQVGWDPRYSDGYGRTLYVGAQYAF